MKDDFDERFDRVGRRADRYLDKFEENFDKNASRFAKVAIIGTVCSAFVSIAIAAGVIGLIVFLVLRFTG